MVRVYLEEHKVSVEDGSYRHRLSMTGDRVAMTNHTWAFAFAEMQKHLGFSHLEIINDLHRGFHGYPNA
ncbi:glucokinase [Shigella flexneri]